MSVSVEQPLHFSQQPSSPTPSFSSPPQSPSHMIHVPAPTPAPPPPSNDIDMSSSVTTLGPAGQRHDREDADMQDGETAVGTQPHESSISPRVQTANDNSVAIEVAAVDEDEMEVTQYIETELAAIENAPADAQEAAITTPHPPAPNEPASNEPENNEQQLPPPPQDLTTQTEPAIPADPTLPADPSLQPPPPPPPVDPVRSDSDSSDDDDGVQPWHPMQEDTSSPDEEELKEIEASTEHSALDHEYWESKAFVPLEDPEYTAGESGRIEWSIDVYNGTREKPNRDIVMKSEIVTIGGHQWQIKFYPKGNDSDYLSVYLECLSVMEPKEKEKDENAEGETKDKEGGEAKDESVTKEPEEKTEARNKMETSTVLHQETVTPQEPVEYQHAPLPLLDSKQLPRRKCVAAQVSVVLYNPTEPRVNYSRTALHCFCSGSPDWGWTRFHGPYYDIANRLRGQRQALLRDDKLAFTAFIRVVEDNTNCLWEHHSRENPWDSFAMTGLQSLILGENASAPGGNMISAIASWMLFKPFRKLMYSIHVPDPLEEPHIRPKPLLIGLQKVLYMMRTQVEPGAGPVPLDDVLDALEWYGISQSRMDKLDVIKTWEVLRIKLEEELQGMPQADSLQALLGPKRDYTSSTPIYRVPVVGVETMQEAVNRLSDFSLPDQCPQLLSIEMERQEFDNKTRSYVKVLNKVNLDDQITVQGTGYTLYGFVAHKQTLQSYVYHPVIRPEGPGSRWYTYSDSKDENQVKCLTKRQAIDELEGKSGTDRIIGNDAVAYIAMYIRDDLAQDAFISDANTEQWDVPEWIRTEVKKSSTPIGHPHPPPPPPPPPVEKPEEGTSIETKDPEPSRVLDFQVIDSRVFDQHEGPGIFDAYDAKWTPGNSEHVHTIQLTNKYGCEDIVDKLVSFYPDIKNRRQIIFWFVDPIQGSFGRPQLVGTGKVLYSRGTYDRYTENKEWTLEDLVPESRRIWVHIVDFADLPELPAPREEKTVDVEVPPHATVVVDEMQIETAPTDTTQPAPTPVPDTTTQVEDTPMSEPDEPIEQVEVQVLASESSNLLSNEGSGDAPMVEVDSAAVPDPPVIDINIPAPVTSGHTEMNAAIPPPPVINSTLPPLNLGDTEMGGTQDLPPPPPPPIDLPVEPSEPPPPVRAPSPRPPPDEIYFFLKLWNAESQALESKGSHIKLKSARVDETVVTLLGLPIEDKKKVEMWEEEELTTARPVKHRRSFAQLDLQNATILIVALPQTAEQQGALAARAAFADPQTYLSFRAFARNFPHKLNGHFTYSYFSSEYYKGEYQNGHRHGHGTQIYHSGATYSGSFRLGQRHGHGLYTFQNGDTYDGEWVANQQHGSGTFIEAATGNTYVGGWKQDKKFGEGVTHWKNAQEAERMCRICWDEPAEAAFYDCGHVVACLGCAREVQNCPVCRKRVLSAMKLYYVA